MTSRRATVTKVEIERSVKGAIGAGLEVARVEVDHKTGKVTIFADSVPTIPVGMTPLQKWEADHGNS